MTATLQTIQLTHVKIRYVNYSVLSSSRIKGRCKTVSSICIVYK